MKQEIAGDTTERLCEDVDLMQRRRILGIWTLITVLMAVLVGRLFLLTLIPDTGPRPLRWQDHIRVRAQMEHLRGIVTDDARGRILYRNGQPLSGQTKHVQLTTLNGSFPYVSHTERSYDGSYKSTRPGVEIAGEVGLPDEWPTPDRVIAEQGRSGLEASFDRLLRGQRPGYIGVERHPGIESHTDEMFQVAPKPGPDLRTTLDPFWEETAEQALANARVPLGAVVILDVKTNEALALANRSTSGTWDLPVVRPAVPGSVMKLVTAAAAFESYRFTPDAVFYCDGVSHLPGVNMHCWTVHGKETLTDAIARSCDVALSIVGTRVGRVGLETVWDKLHLSETGLQSVKGHPVLEEAQGGTLFRRTGNDNGLLANTSIGQEDVRISPLQAANLASTIAQNGTYRDVQLVLDAEMNHRTARWFEQNGSERALSPFTARKIAAGMQEAVTDPSGTAHDLASLPVSAAVKTGTAELPTGRVNGWMIGFAPAANPQIAFSIYVGDVPSQTAHTSVHEMAKAVLTAYRQFLSQPVIG